MEKRTLIFTLLTEIIVCLYYRSSWCSVDDDVEIVVRLLGVNRLTQGVSLVDFIGETSTSKLGQIARRLSHFSLFPVPPPDVCQKRMAKQAKSICFRVICYQLIIDALSYCQRR